MQIASSANRTCSEFLSASLYTATVRIPISLHALITRSAISPRFAIRTLRNINPDAFHRTLHPRHWSCRGLIKTSSFRPERSVVEKSAVSPSATNPRHGKFPTAPGWQTAPVHTPPLLHSHPSPSPLPPQHRPHSPPSP